MASQIKELSCCPACSVVVGFRTAGISAYPILFKCRKCSAKLTFKRSIAPFVLTLVTYVILVFGVNKVLRLFVQEDVVIGTAMLAVIVGGWAILLWCYLRYVEKRCELVEI